MQVILGLDVSTSCTGLCLLNMSDYGPENKHIMRLEAIMFNKCKTLWDKADVIYSTLNDLRLSLELQNLHVARVVVEEPLLGFRQGMSSAQTLTQLMKFNGIVSYIARGIFNAEPEYISAAHARKLCGMKLQRTAVAGSQKEQVFSHMSQHDLSHVQWPLTKTGKVVPWSRDATDAYVIARAASVNEIPIVKAPKVKKTTAKNKK